MRKVEVTIQINARTENVFSAFTDANQLREWWNVDRCFIDLKDNGNYTLAWNISENGFQYIFTGIIKRYEHDKILHIGSILYLNSERSILGPFELLLKLNSKSTGTNLYLKQWPYPENKGNDMEWYYKSVKNAWPTVLQTLKKYIEQK